MKRPLLQAITESDKAPVLLIDEIDRADEEFKLLLNFFRLSNYYPEMGTIKTKHIPIVVLTSNRTQELSDALKRRCLYHCVPYPEFQKELAIINKHLPNINQVLARNWPSLFNICEV